MPKRKLKKTSHFSWRIGKLAKGCEHCVLGEKTVFFVTGLCGRSCYFCPLSELKKNQDVIYANERPVHSFEDLADEIRACGSKGVGITGGDPLVKLDRTCEYIQKLRKEFGNDFHIHLYTPPDLATKENLERLFSAGLDEIRFHPYPGRKDTWKPIETAKEFGWQVGVEIPVIPEQEKDIMELIDYLDKIKIDFLNLNELEFSSTNADALRERGYTTKDHLSYGVKGSEQLAKKLLMHLMKNTSLNVHYCTARLKDRMQLGSRLKNRAKSTKKEFDLVDDEGLFTRGAIYFPELCPGFDYKKTLASVDDKSNAEAIKRLEVLKAMLERQFKIPEELFAIDKERLRLLTTNTVVHNLAAKIKQAGFRPAIVTEYPTWDCFIVELEFL